MIRTLSNSRRRIAGSDSTVSLDTPDDLIWLPNALVTGASGERPPVARLRQTREIEVLETFIEVYGEHDLAGDGGLPRRLLYGRFDREHVLDMGQFVVYGFNMQADRFCKCDGPFQKYNDRQHGEGSAWERLEVMRDLGLLQWVIYLAEDGEADGELLHALTGDAEAYDVLNALCGFSEKLPGGFAFGARRYDCVIPVLRHMSEATLVEVCRLRYRPRTSLTSAWHAHHIESCRAYASFYRGVASGELRKIA